MDSKPRLEPNGKRKPMNSKNLPLLKAKNTAVIFDGDDTLWDTMPTYTRIKNKFFVLMGREGFDATRVQDSLSNGISKT